RSGTARHRATPGLSPSQACLLLDRGHDCGHVLLRDGDRFDADADGVLADNDDFHAALVVAADPEPLVLAWRVGVAHRGAPIRRSASVRTSIRAPSRPARM